MQMGERLRKLRLKAGLTQVGISKLIGLDQSTYSKVEKNKRCLSLNKGIKAALVLNTSLDYLYGLTEQREPYPRSSRCSV